MCKNFMLWTKTMHVNFYINIIHFAPAVHFSFHSSHPTFFYISNKNWILNSSWNFHNSLIYNYLQINYLSKDKSCLLICYFSYQKQFLSWKFSKIGSNQFKKNPKTLQQSLNFCVKERHMALYLNRFKARRIVKPPTILHTSQLASYVYVAPGLLAPSLPLPWYHNWSLLTRWLALTKHD